MPGGVVTRETRTFAGDQITGKQLVELPHCDITEKTEEGTNVVLATLSLPGWTVRGKSLPTADIHVALINIHCVNERSNGELKWKICKKIIWYVRSYVILKGQFKFVNIMKTFGYIIIFSLTSVYSRDVYTSINWDPRNPMWVFGFRVVAYDFRRGFSE